MTKSDHRPPETLYSSVSSSFPDFYLTVGSHLPTFATPIAFPIACPTPAAYPTATGHYSSAYSHSSPYNPVSYPALAATHALTAYPTVTARPASAAFFPTYPPLYLRRWETGRRPSASSDYSPKTRPEASRNGAKVGSGSERQSSVSPALSTRFRASLPLSPPLRSLPPLRPLTSATSAATASTAASVLPLAASLSEPNLVFSSGTRRRGERPLPALPPEAAFLFRKKTAVSRRQSSDFGVSAADSFSFVDRIDKAAPPAAATRTRNVCQRTKDVQGSEIVRARSDVSDSSASRASTSFYSTSAATSVGSRGPTAPSTPLSGRSGPPFALASNPFFVIPKDPRSPYAFTTNHSALPTFRKKYCSKVILTEDWCMTCW